MSVIPDWKCGILGDVTKLIFADISTEGILFIEGIVFSFTTIVHHDSQGDFGFLGLDILCLARFRARFTLLFVSSGAQPPKQSVWNAKIKTGHSL